MKSEESLRSMSDATLALSARVNVDEILGSSGTSALLLTLIHRSAWKGNSANFVLTEFYEVRLKTNSQKFWAPHRHTKDRGPVVQGLRPGKGRLALREATPM